MLVGGSFKKHRRFVLGDSKTKGCTCLPNLKVHEEALTGFSHVYHAGVFHTISLSQGYMSLDQSMGSGKASVTHIPRTREGVRSLQKPGFSSQIKWPQ